MTSFEVPIKLFVGINTDLQLLFVGWPLHTRMYLCSDGMDAIELPGQRGAETEHRINYLPLNFSQFI